MTELELFLPFGEQDIDKKNYTASLLILCSANNLLSNAQSERVQKVISDVFIETLEQFTNRESSTVSNENARSIYDSVLYRADVYLKSLGSIVNAVNALINEDFVEILKKGSSLVLDDFVKAERYFLKARDKMLNWGSGEYKYASMKAFRVFKHEYSARFFAKNINVTIDYPLLYAKPYEMTGEGVLFMAEYYRALSVENSFCSLFSKSDIHNLLISYGEMMGCRYSDLLVNYCGIAANNFFANLLLGKKGLNLLMSADDIENLVGKLSFSTAEQIRRMLLSAFYSEISDHEIRLYLRRYVDIFAHELLEHILNGTVNVFIAVS